MRRAARAALAVAPSVAVVLVAGAPGALAAHKPSSHSTPAHSTPSHSTAPVHHAPPPPAVPAATRGMATSFAGCQSKPSAAAHRLRSVPWAQQMLDFSSVWDITRGRRVTVAVVDSGVQDTPQLAGRASYYVQSGPGPADCVGHGTAVASIIGASDELSKGIPFYGVAPAARILSIKVQSSENQTNLSVLPQGIMDAVHLHARVINVSIQGPPTPALHLAVDYALRHNVVVVAAAGNDSQTTSGTVSKGPFYPASYPGVLSVGAVSRGGEITQDTQGKTPISVVAPGANVQSDYPGGFSEADTGTSFAAPFVSGEAALLRSAFPHMTESQVVARIIATADGNTGARTGAGMINPVEAVTGLLAPQAATPSANAQPVAIPAVPHGNPTTHLVAMSVTGGGIALAVVVVVVAMTLPSGRRRHWRPARVDLRALGTSADDTGSVWGDDLPTTDQQIAPSGPGAGQAGPRPLPPG